MCMYVCIKSRFLKYAKVTDIFTGLSSKLMSLSGLILMIFSKLKPMLYDEKPMAARIFFGLGIYYGLSL